MAYIGTEGYLVNLELRIGKQHCQKETPDFLRETIELCRQLTEHAGRLVLSIGRSNRWRFTFKRLYDSFAFIT